MKDRSIPLFASLYLLSCFVGKQKIKWNEHELVERRSDECLSLVATNGASLKRWERPHEHMRAAAGARRWGQRQEQGMRLREGGEGSWGLTVLRDDHPSSRWALHM